MKRTITLIAILSLVSLSALSQRRSSGNVRGGISIGNGDDVIRIDINNRSRETRSLKQRVRKLERAVNQLQNMVYDLQDDRDVVVVDLQFKCKTVRTSWGTTYYGKPARTEASARESSIQACLRKESFSSSCSTREAKTTCWQE